jgi:NTE family protein
LRTTNIFFMTRIYFLLVLFFVSLAGHAFCEDPEARPKIGLVLSGGGAKGLAHIGILRAMEKAGLTPDYITGTSMGSIVGALYAIGYSADDIEKIVKDVDWDTILSNQIPLNQITYEEKFYYGRYIAELPVDGIKVGLPRGLIEGQKLSERLSRITRAAHDIEDFNNLPIPFACVAADIANGEPVVLNKGSLPEAIRASMAIPTVFTPVEINGRLLVDGGLVRNFPVEEVIDMGADIVIGVFVSSDLNSKEELNDFISLLTQSAFVTSAIDSRQQREFVDIYVEPDLKGYSPGSFRQWQEIINIGNQTGEKYYETFQQLAYSLSVIEPLKSIDQLPEKNSYLITEISITGNEKISSKIIRGKLRITEGSILSIDEIEKQISIIYGTRYFDKVEYEIITNGPRHKLLIKVREAPDGYLKLAAHYDSENEVGINANLTYRNLLLQHSRALLEFDFSKNPRLDINYLKYLGWKQNMGFQIGYNFRDNDLPFYEEEIETSRLDSDYSEIYALLQSTAFQNFTFGGKAMIEFSELTPKVGEIGRIIEVIKNRNLSAEFYIKYNSLDRQFFPKKGAVFEASVKHTFDVKNRYTSIPEDTASTTNSTIVRQLDPFTAFEIQFIQIFKLHNRFSIISDNAMALSTLGDFEYNITDYYFIGGFKPRGKKTSKYWGAQDKKYLAPNYFYTKLTLQWEVFDNFFLSGIANYIDVQYPMELFYGITVGDYLDGEKRRFGYGFSLGYNSFLGPISFSLARDSGSSENQMNLNIGFWFK